MSYYSTGEIAKLCNTTIRSVQYYDSCGILIPTEISEGGRRLYSDKDVHKLKVICFLREIGCSIDSIHQMISNDSNDTIRFLIYQHQLLLKEKIDKDLGKLETLNELASNMDYIQDFSFDHFADIINMMKNKNKLYQLHYLMNFIGILLMIIGILSILFSIQFKNISYCIIGFVLITCIIIFSSSYYNKKTSYVCPHCHSIFKSDEKESFFAGHTPTTRNVTCPKCNQKNYCLTLYENNA